MYDKVLILSASAGAGHLRAAQALEKAFHDLGAARQVLHVDALDYTTLVYRQICSQVYVEIATAVPDLLGWMYDRLDKPFKSEKMRYVIDRMNSGAFMRMIKKHQPDLAVCTHFLPAELISALKGKGVVNFPMAVCVTDLDAHALWLTRHFEHYFVALDETREHLLSLGFPAEKVTASGIPIDPVFALPRDKAEMRRKHGLPIDRAVILVGAGGFGVGHVEHLITSLLKLKSRTQVLVICGRNEKLRKKIDALIDEMDGDEPVRVQAQGYTTQMDELMAAADLLVGKAGGLTTSEALARGLPMMIFNPIPGQEERNSDHLLEDGAALRCNNLPVMAYKVDRLLADRRRLAAMRESALRIAHPDSARDVVRTLLAMRAAGPQTCKGVEPTEEAIAVASSPRQRRKRRDRLLRAIKGKR